MAMVRTLTTLIPGRSACGRSHVMLASERWTTLQGTLPIDTAGTTPSPAAASSATLSPSPVIVACGGEDAESVMEAMDGVNSSEALYLQAFAARH